MNKYLDKSYSVTQPFKKKISVIVLMPCSFYLSVCLIYINPYTERSAKSLRFRCVIGCSTPTTLSAVEAGIKNGWMDGSCLFISIANVWIWWPRWCCRLYLPNQFDCKHGVHATAPVSELWDPHCCQTQHLIALMKDLAPSKHRAPSVGPGNIVESK